MLIPINQEFGKRIFGVWGGTAYSLAVASSCLGALNANVFATGRLIVAASMNHYLPRLFSNTHCLAREEEISFTRNAVKHLPYLFSTIILWFVRRTQSLRWDTHVPM